MLERVFKSRRVIQQYRQGPLRDHIDEFLAVRVRQKGDHLLPGADGRIAKGHSHATEAEGRDLQIAVA